MDKCAFDVGGTKCAALTQRRCTGCPFCKTVEDLQRGRDKAMERIESLPNDQYAHIMEVYYSDYSKSRWGGEVIDKRRKHQAACAH